MSGSLSRRGLSGTALKILALLLMVLDHIEYFFQFTGVVPLWFSMAGQQELTRAVENFLANSVRFTPAGGHITFCCTVSPTSVLLAVEDTGPGFPEEILRSGGQMFLTGDIARGDGHQGLGLYFARTVAQAHGGQLLLRNTETGAYAALQLPRSPCFRP